MSTGSEAVGARYGPQVWEFIHFSPARERDDVRVYSRESPYVEEMAEARYSEVQAKVFRAERDAPFALDWAKRILATGAMHDPWSRLSLAEKLAKAAEQDYEDGLVIYRRAVREGRFEKLRQPFASIHPDHARAFKTVQQEWIASLPEEEPNGEAEGRGHGGPEGGPAQEDPDRVGALVQQLLPAGEPEQLGPTAHEG